MLKKLLWTALLWALLLPGIVFAQSPSAVEFLLSGFTDNSGQPLSGGLVYTYIAGTTTAKATYSDSAATTPLTNPIVLDSNGRKQVYANGSYKFVVQTAAGATLYTFDNLRFNLSVDGWRPGEETPTYLSSGSMTVASDGTARYRVGQKVRFKQGGGYKYGYLTQVASTSVNFNAGSDYTVANAAITDFSTSDEVNPLGFPTWFNYTPTLTGFSANPSYYARFRMVGAMIHVRFNCTGNGTSNATTFAVTVPITATGSSDLWGTTLWSAVDNGATLTVAGRGLLAFGTVTVNLYANMGTGGWTNVNGKQASFDIFYER